MSTPTPEEREMLLEMPAARALIAEAVAAERERCVVEVEMIRDCRVYHYRKLRGIPELAFEELCQEVIERIRGRGTS